MIQDSRRRQAKPAQLNVLAVTTSFGLAVGIGIGLTGVQSLEGKVMALGIASGGIGAIATYLVMDSRHTARRNDLEAKVKKANLAQGESQTNLNRSDIKVKEIQAEIELVRKAAGETELSLKADVQESIETYRKALEAQCTTEVELVQVKTKIEGLEAENTRLGRERDEVIARLADLMSGMDDDIAEKVASQTATRVDVIRRGEIKQIATEYESLASQLFGLFERLESWGGNVKESHDAKSVLLQGLVEQYTGTIDGLKTSVQSQTDSYLAQIEILNEKIGLLQHQMAGDLVEPIYGEFGHDRNGQIANAIAEIAFRELNIPLAVKGFSVKPDGSIDVGCDYSRSSQVEALVSDLSRQLAYIAKRLGIHKITSVRKLEIADLIVLTFRREPAVKENDIRLMVGSSDEFIAYVTSNPIRYRLIADPGSGKTPVTAVMVSEILKAGCHRGNVAKGKEVPNTLVTVAYPDALSSLKDSEYPLELFLEYGDTTASIKSFKDACDDWEYRKQNVVYAENFFKLWVWDELDHTLDSASDPNAVATNLKLLLKKGGHNNIGYIVSGQSVMTKQIPGFTIDDRSLFTEIIIGIPKIRHYLKTYGKGKQAESNLAKLAHNLNELEGYIESKNELITDDARLLRVALVIDSRSPKLFFLPNLDRVKFDITEIEQSRRLADEFKRSSLPSRSDAAPTGNIQNPFAVSIDENGERSSNLTKGGNGQSVTSPHCPHCGASELKLLGDDRYNCKECKKRFVESKVVWK